MSGNLQALRHAETEFAPFRVRRGLVHQRYETLPRPEKASWGGFQKEPATVETATVAMRHQAYSTPSFPSANLDEIFQKVREEKRAMVQEYVANSKWGKPCEDLFTHMAYTKPGFLLDLIRVGELREAMLSFAAESAGLITTSREVVAVLTPLLQQTESSLVREGAVYGLKRHLKEQGVRELLQERLAVEESRGVRAALEEALEGEDEDE